MAGSNRQMNWDGVSFTPTSGSAVPIDGVTSLSIDPNASVKKFSGDGDRGPTTVVSDYVDNMITITTAAIQSARSLTAGTYGAFAGTLKDSKRGAQGDIAFAVADPSAMIQNGNVDAKHRDFATARIMICCEWADGTTDPLSSTVDTSA